MLPQTNLVVQQNLLTKNKFYHHSPQHSEQNYIQINQNIKPGQRIDINIDVYFQDNSRSSQQQFQQGIYGTRSQVNFNNQIYIEQDNLSQVNIVEIERKAQLNNIRFLKNRNVVEKINIQQKHQKCTICQQIYNQNDYQYHISQHQNLHKNINEQINKNLIDPNLLKRYEVIQMPINQAQKKQRKQRQKIHQIEKKAPEQNQKQREVQNKGKIEKASEKKIIKNIEQIENIKEKEKELRIEEIEKEEKKGEKETKEQKKVIKEAQRYNIGTEMIEIKESKPKRPKEMQPNIVSNQQSRQISLDQFAPQQVINHSDYYQQKQGPRDNVSLYSSVDSNVNIQINDDKKAMGPNKGQYVNGNMGLDMKSNQRVNPNIGRLQRRIQQINQQTKPQIYNLNAQSLEINQSKPKRPKEMQPNIVSNQQSRQISLDQFAPQQVINHSDYYQQKQGPRDNVSLYSSVDSNVNIQINDDKKAMGPNKGQYVNGNMGLDMKSNQRVNPNIGRLQRRIQQINQQTKPQIYNLNAQSLEINQSKPKRPKEMQPNIVSNQQSRQISLDQFAPQQVINHSDYYQQKQGPRDNVSLYSSVDSNVNIQINDDKKAMGPNKGQYVNGNMGLDMKSNQRVNPNIGRLQRRIQQINQQTKPQIYNLNAQSLEINQSKPKRPKEMQPNIVSNQQSRQISLDQFAPQQVINHSDYYQQKQGPRDNVSLYSSVDSNVNIQINDDKKAMGPNKGQYVNGNMGLDMKSNQRVNPNIGRLQRRIQQINQQTKPQIYNLNAQSLEINQSKPKRPKEMQPNIVSNQQSRQISLDQFAPQQVINHSDYYQQKQGPRDNVSLYSSVDSNVNIQINDDKKAMGPNKGQYVNGNMGLDMKSNQRVNPNIGRLQRRIQQINQQTKPQIYNLNAQSLEINQSKPKRPKEMQPNIVSNQQSRQISLDQFAPQQVINHSDYYQQKQGPRDNVSLYSSVDSNVNIQINDDKKAMGPNKGQYVNGNMGLDMKSNQRVNPNIGRLQRRIQQINQQTKPQIYNLNAQSLEINQSKPKRPKEMQPNIVSNQQSRQISLDQFAPQQVINHSDYYQQKQGPRDNVSLYSSVDSNVNIQINDDKKAMGPNKGQYVNGNMGLDMKSNQRVNPNIGRLQRRIQQINQQTKPQIYNLNAQSLEINQSKPKRPKEMQPNIVSNQQSRQISLDQFAPQQVINHSDYYQQKQGPRDNVSLYSSVDSNVNIQINDDKKAMGPNKGQYVNGNMGLDMKSNQRVNPNIGRLQRRIQQINQQTKPQIYNLNAQSLEINQSKPKRPKEMQPNIVSNQQSRQISLDQFAPQQVINHSDYYQQKQGPRDNVSLYSSVDSNVNIQINDDKKAMGPNKGQYVNGNMGLDMKSNQRVNPNIGRLQRRIQQINQQTKPQIYNLNAQSLEINQSKPKRPKEMQPNIVSNQQSRQISLDQFAPQQVINHSDYYQQKQGPRDNVSLYSSVDSNVNIQINDDKKAMGPNKGQYVNGNMGLDMKSNQRVNPNIGRLQRRIQQINQQTKPQIYNLNAQSLEINQSKPKRPKEMQPNIVSNQQSRQISLDQFAPQQVINHSDYYQQKQGPRDNVSLYSSVDSNVNIQINDDKKAMGPNKGQYVNGNMGLDMKSNQRVNPNIGRLQRRIQQINQQTKPQIYNLNAQSLEINQSKPKRPKEMQPNIVSNQQSRQISLDQFAPQQVINHSDYYQQKQGPRDNVSLYSSVDSNVNIQINDDKKAMGPNKGQYVNGNMGLDMKSNQRVNPNIGRLQRRIQQINQQTKPQIYNLNAQSLEINQSKPKRPKEMQPNIVSNQQSRQISLDQFAPQQVINHSDYYQQKQGPQLSYYRPIPYNNLSPYTIQHKIEQINQQYNQLLDQCNLSHIHQFNQNAYSIDSINYMPDKLIKEKLFVRVPYNVIESWKYGHHPNLIDPRANLVLNTNNNLQSIPNKNSANHPSYIPRHPSNSKYNPPPIVSNLQRQGQPSLTLPNLIQSELYPVRGHSNFLNPQTNQQLIPTKSNQQPYPANLMNKEQLELKNIKPVTSSFIQYEIPGEFDQKRFREQELINEDRYKSEEYKFDQRGRSSQDNYKLNMKIYVPDKLKKQKLLTKVPQKIVENWKIDNKKS